jgi:hypothetical protein
MIRNTSNLSTDISFSERSPQNGIDMPPDATPAPMSKSQLKELPISLIGRGEVKGFVFRQIAKSERGLLYQVAQPGGLIHYEIFRRVENIRFKCISYPGSRSFGISAWTMKDLNSALQRFENF